MRTSVRIVVAVAVLLVIGALAALGWWYQSRQQAPAASAALTVNVTSDADRGPGTLREALFIAATAKGQADVLLKVKSIAPETPLPPLVNPHGVRVVAQQGGTEIDAHALTGGGAVFDVAGDNVSLVGLTLRNCQGTAVLLRAARFHLQGSTVDSCDVGVDVAENAHGVLLERNRFSNDRIGVRLAASAPDTVIVGNEFSNNKDAGLWAVRGEADARGTAITVRENRFNTNRSGIVAANVGLLIERNEFADAPEGAIHLLGAGAVVRGNHVRGGPGMGIIAETARESIIESNELEHLTAYGIMVRGSANVLLRANRIVNCGYGLAFVLGDARRPSTAVDNTIIEPQFNGIDVIGDSPILRHNQVLKPGAFALHVIDFQPPDGAKVAARPFLDNNNFKADSASVASSAPAGTVRQP